MAGDKAATCVMGYYERLLICLSSLVNFTNTIVVMITIKEKPSADVVTREVVLLLIE